jgi:flavin-binding protein dodecin
VCGIQATAVTIVFVLRDYCHGLYFIAAIIFIPNRTIMSVIKVIEVLSESQVSWVDAARQALDKVSKTIRNVKSVCIKDHGVNVENGEIKSYRINAKVSFLLD